MSAEVTTIKKRGRPPKKAVSSPADDNNVIVELDAEATPLQQKTRGKSSGGNAAKKSPTLTTTSSTSTAAEKKLKADVESASATNSTVTSTAKKRVVKSSSTAATAAAAAPEGKVQSASTKTGKAKPVSEPEVVKVKAKAKSSSEKTASSVKAATTKAAGQVKKQQSTQEIQAPVPPQEGEQLSEILQQARAFAKSPQEPNKSIRRLAQDREEETESTLSASTAGSLSGNAARGEETPIEQQSGSEQLETPSSRQILDSPRYLNSTPEIPQVSEMPQAPASLSSLPTKLLTTNPLFTTTRPKYTLPYSTTAALASRQQQQQEQSQSTPRPMTRLSTSKHLGPGGSRGRILPPPSEQPPGPRKPTQMQYAELKRDPKFRELSSRWTRILVALPIAIVTSYYVYQRRDEQRLYEQGLLMAGTITGVAETSPSVPASNADTTVAEGNGGRSGQ